MKAQSEFRLLPQMVKWFSPRLLIQAGFRDSVARLFGQYADQRTIQHLEDRIPNSDAARRQFVERYDYSGATNSSEPFWVDYASDLGDGFDSTYAIAYLLAADELRGDKRTRRIRAVKNLPQHERLKSGRVLVFGGDQVYPWPSREEYVRRMLTPYRYALPEIIQSDLNRDIEKNSNNSAPQSSSNRSEHQHGSEPGGENRQKQRDIYSIPGNHDWYDGLAAFDDLFCRARSGRPELSVGQVGGWKTRQHRSYFALKLPYNWWIWGADIQLNRHLDDGQLEYFNTVSSIMEPGDKFILCTAQPSWLYFDTENGNYARENLRHLIDTPISKGAKLCAVLSGDNHHYSRYNETDQLGNFNLITAGGGGAYTHGTHHLDSSIEFEWVGRNLDFVLNRKLEPSKNQEKPKVTTKPACYPSKGQSRRMAWSSWRFPARNVAFCLFMGLIYWLLTWTFSELRVEYNLQTQETEKVKEKVERQIIRQNEIKRERFRRYQFRRPPQTRTFSTEPPDTESAERQAPAPTDVRPDRSIREWTIGVVKNYLDEISSKDLLSSEGLGATFSLALQGTYLLLLGIASSPFAFAFLFLVWLTFYSIAQTRRQGRSATISRLISGSFHFGVHLFAMWVLFCLLIYANNSIIKPFLDARANDEHIWFFLPTELWEKIVYPPEMIILGGIVSGLVFGFYLLVTYNWGKVNPDWAFSAQRSTQYKNFMRLKFEPDFLTIYPIGLDTVPGRRRWWFSAALPGWRWKEKPQPGESLVEPLWPLAPRLIEGPIIIDAREVRNIPRDPG